MFPSLSAAVRISATSTGEAECGGLVSECCPLVSRMCEADSSGEGAAAEELMESEARADRFLREAEAPGMGDLPRREVRGALRRGRDDDAGVRGVANMAEDDAHRPRSPRSRKRRSRTTGGRRSRPCRCFQFSLFRTFFVCFSRSFFGAGGKRASVKRARHGT